MLCGSQAQNIIYQFSLSVLKPNAKTVYRIYNKIDKKFSCFCCFVFRYYLYLREEKHKSNQNKKKNHTHDLFSNIYFIDPPIFYYIVVESLNPTIEGISKQQRILYGQTLKRYNYASSFSCQFYTFSYRMKRTFYYRTL